MNNLENVKNSLTSKSLRVCVVGIGRIGLPTALLFAKSGLNTIGVVAAKPAFDAMNTNISPEKLRLNKNKKQENNNK